MGNQSSKPQQQKPDLKLDEFQEVRDFMEHGKLKGGRDVESVIEDKLAKVSRAVSEKVPDDVKRAAKDAANNIIKTVDKAGKEISKNVSELASQADGATRRVAKEAAAAGVATQDSLQRLWRKTKSHAEDLLNKVDDVKHKEVAGWTPLPSHKEIVIPPIGTMLLGWASLLGVQSIFSLPQYRQPIERLVGGKTVFNVLGGSVCGAIAGALGYYWHKEGQFLGPNINHAVPEVFTDALKALAIVGASQSLVNYAPSINDLVSGKVSLFDDGQETGAKRISRHVLLYSLGAFGLAHALEKRNLGNWLFWGLMPVYATVAGYLNDKRTDTDPSSNFLPFQQIINGGASIFDALKETNWPVAIVALGASLPKVFPEVWEKVSKQLGL